MSDDHEFAVVAASGQRAVLRRDLVTVPLEVFWAEGVPLAEAKGRGGAAVTELLPGVRGVVRDYRRGGALSFLFGRSYLDRGRAERELRVLAELRARGVPVVEPLAALSRRYCGVFHRLRLITKLVEGAVPLPAFVAAHPALRRAAVAEAGRVVGLAFDIGLLHRDLHPDNLVARRVGTGVEVVLLDLDRAAIRASLDGTRRDRMLLRMARYLRRHAEDLPIRPTASEPLRFLAGMGLDRAARRAEVPRLGALLVRELTRHGLS